MYLISFIPTAAVSLASWLLGALSMALLLAHKPRFERPLVLTLEWREWFAKGRDDRGPWGYSTTIVRTVWYQPGARDRSVADDERVEQHEHVHVRQWEDAMLWSTVQGFIALAVGAGWRGALVLHLSGVVAMGASYAAALLRNGPAKERGSLATRVFDSLYYESEMERSAYAQTDEWPGGGSWEREWRRQSESRRRELRPRSK